MSRVRKPHFSGNFVRYYGGPLFDTPSFVFGPVGGPLHCTDKRVELDFVLQTLKVLTSIIVAWCGV
jgi:hypothetical protein